MSGITLEQLRQYPVFRGCGPDEIERLARCMKFVQLSEPGAVLFEDQVDSDAAYLVQSGTLVAELPLEEGIAVEMARMGPGSVVGELCLIKGGPRSLRVKCLDDVKLIRIDRAAFHSLRLAKDAAAYTVIRNICLTMCDRLRITNEFIERELRHESPTTADFTSLHSSSIAERARSYLSKLFGKGS